MGLFGFESIWLDVVLLVVSLAFLAFFSMRFIRVLNTLSLYGRVPKFLLSFIVLGFGASLPDLFIAGFSSVQGQLPLVVGAVIGSNVILLTVVLGVITVLKGSFKVREKTVLENFGWLFFVIVIPFFFLIDGRLTFTEGVILVIVYFMYLYNIHSEVRSFKASGVQTELLLGDNQDLFWEHHSRPYYRKSVLREAGKALVILAVLLVSAHFVVAYSMSVSSALGIPEVLIGLTIVAIGITLPELILDLSALRAKEEEVIWGDLIGSFVTELTLVLGVAALFTSPDNGVFSFADSIVGYLFMAISFAIVFFFAYSKKELNRAQGLALIFLYLVFLSIQLDLIAFNGLPISFGAP